jgi:hypothetical protein
MKLTDFMSHEGLNRLREQMGLRHDEFGSTSAVVIGGGLTRE